MEHSCLLLITFSPVSDEGPFVKGVPAIFNVALFTGKFTSCVIISFVQIIVIVNDGLPSRNELSVQHENFALIHWKNLSIISLAFYYIFNFKFLWIRLHLHIVWLLLVLCTLYWKSILFFLIWNSKPFSVCTASKKHLLDLLVFDSCHCLKPLSL